MTEPAMRSELDFLVECIRRMRLMRSVEGHKAAARFQQELEEYFRLNQEMRSSFVYDELLRLADLPPGSGKMRDQTLLRKIHEMYSGQYFRLDGRLCVFKNHTGRTRVPKDGFFEYSYYSELGINRTMDYNRAWSLAAEGKLTFDK